MIVINALACTLITRYLLYAPCVEGTSPPSEGLGEAFFTSTCSLVHLLPIMSMKSVFLKIINLGERENNSRRGAFYYLILSPSVSVQNCVKDLPRIFIL